MSHRLAGALLLTLWALASSAADAPREFFDERTGATVTVAYEPTLFAARKGVGIASKPAYIGLTPVQIDRSGVLTLYLIAYSWTREDPRTKGAILTVQADNEALTLKPLDTVPNDLSDARKFPDGGSFFPPLVYSVTTDTLRKVAFAQRLVARFGTGDAPAAADIFEPWGDGRKSLVSFVNLITPQS